MWSRTLRASRRLGQTHRLTLPRRNVGGQAAQPHTTYFQQPPPPPPTRGRRIIRNVLWSTFCFTLGAGTFLAVPSELLAEFAGVHLGDGEAAQNLYEALLAGTEDAAARHAPPLDANHATELLIANSGFSVTPTAVSHNITSPSNLPCEDASSSGAYNMFKDEVKDWYEWAIFDGHAGSRTSQFLKDNLPKVVGEHLWEAKCMNKPNEALIVSTIKKAFQSVDDEIIKESGKTLQAGGPFAEMVTTGAIAYAGSCALMALYDPVRSILRIANVGDSRAVLGRWNSASQRYEAMPLSVDQTGFNQDEVERIAADHPGEEGIVDPESGRVFGLAITRAFGDARWKWAEELYAKPTGRRRERGMFRKSELSPTA